MGTIIRRYVRSLGLDAYVVGGAVRDELLGIAHADEDFLVPGVDTHGLRELLRPHGRIEDLVVQGRLVGVRLHPRDRDVHLHARAGIEFTPPRAERSTGPRHQDFEIVSGPGITVEEDMARRDFTVNAMARRLADGALVDPFGGRADLEAGVLRTVTAHSFAEDPLRILRGLRLVSQLAFTLAPATVEQMRSNASGLGHVSAERIGGGVAADGRGELSKLLLGPGVATALRLARETTALVFVIPEFEAAIGYEPGGVRQPLPLDEHLIAVTAGAPPDLVVRLAALLHDLGRPRTDATGEDHAAVGATLARVILERLRYPVRLVREVTALIAAHAFHTDRADDVTARRFLAAHGRERAARLLQHKRADLAAKQVSDAERRRLEELAAAVERQQGAAHRLSDLALAGDDLLALGLREGPEVGRVLHGLLERVVDDPSLNTRDALAALALELRS